MLAGITTAHGGFDLKEELVAWMPAMVSYSSASMLDKTSLWARDSLSAR
jgi:hypothetical protein